MFSVRNAGRCLILSTCGCVPGMYTEKMFHRFFIVQSRNSQGIWDYLKERIGFRSKNKKNDMKNEIDSTYLEPEAIPVHSHSPDETWKSNNSDRTERKHF